MKPESKPAASPPSKFLSRLFAAAFGALLGLTLLKFGNPPIMERWTVYPTTFFEFLAGSPWPMNWAYLGLAALALVAIPLCRLKPQPPLWLTLLPLAWLGWTVVSGATSVDRALSHLTLVHFGACVACFYLGLLVLSRVDETWVFLVGLFVAMAIVLAAGFDQHFGGLEESRKYFHRQIEMYPQTANDIPPEFLKKIASNRIYSTLFYPNTLAGALLLFFPVVAAAVPDLRRRLQAVSSSRVPILATLVGTALLCLYLYMLNSTAGWMLTLALGLALVLPGPGFILPALLAAATLACLFWSGSKGGWLLMLLLGLIALLRLPFRRQLKVALVAGVLLIGIGGFVWKYAGFFRKGATSVVARFDYWRAAGVTIGEHPFAGTGPGTFAIPYERIKKPESEMARLVHNDYLEQGSDSGIPAMAFYLVLIAGGLFWIYRRAPWKANPSDGRALFALWLGLLGWAIQCSFEFSLYIPALAWPAFAFLGLLLGRAATPAKAT
jgi:O-antigen ligase